MNDLLAYSVRRKMIERGFENAAAAFMQRYFSGEYGPRDIFRIAIRWNIS